MSKALARDDNTGVRIPTRQNWHQWPLLKAHGTEAWGWQQCQLRAHLPSSWVLPLAGAGGR